MIEVNLAVIKVPCWNLSQSISISLKVQMPIARTTVAGATAVASQFRKELIINLKEFI